MSYHTHNMMCMLLLPMLLVSATSASFVWSLVSPLTLHRTRLQTHTCMKVHKHMKHDNVKHKYVKHSNSYTYECRKASRARQANRAAKGSIGTKRQPAHRDTPTPARQRQASGGSLETSRTDGHHQPQTIPSDKMQHSNTWYNRTIRSIYVHMTECVCNHCSRLGYLYLHICSVKIGNYSPGWLKYIRM